MFSVSVTHYSKIKELSDGNRVMETKWWWCQTDFKLWVPPFLSYELWKLSYELWKLTNQTPSNVSSFKNSSLMIELKFLKLEMQAMASDVEKIPYRTRVPPFSFQISSLSSSSSSPVLSVDLKPSDVPLFCIWCSLVDFFFFPCYFNGSQTIWCSSVLLLMFFGGSQTKFFLCF